MEIMWIILVIWITIINQKGTFFIYEISTIIAIIMKLQEQGPTPTVVKKKTLMSLRITLPNSPFFLTFFLSFTRQKCRLLSLPICFCLLPRMIQKNCPETSLFQLLNQGSKHSALFSLLFLKRNLFLTSPLSQMAKRSLPRQLTFISKIIVHSSSFVRRSSQLLHQRSHGLL